MTRLTRRQPRWSTPPCSSLTLCCGTGSSVLFATILFSTGFSLTGMRPARRHLISISKRQQSALQRTCSPSPKQFSRPSSLPVVAKPPSNIYLLPLLNPVQRATTCSITDAVPLPVSYIARPAPLAVPPRSILLHWFSFRGVGSCLLWVFVASAHSNAMVAVSTHGQHIYFEMVTGAV